MENMRPSLNSAQHFKNGQPIGPSQCVPSYHPNELFSSQHDPEVVTPLRLTDPQHQEENSPNQTDCRPGLPLKASSSSIASSIQTVIHLSAAPEIDPTSTCRTVQGSFVESGSGSSQLLSQLVAKSSNEHPPNSLSESLQDSDLHTNGKRPKIQFHDVIRIAGGISSKSKRKKANKQLSRNITRDHGSSFTAEQCQPSSSSRQPSSSSRSPLRYSGFVEGLPNYSQRQISNPDGSDSIMSIGRSQANGFGICDSSSSPIGRSLSETRKNTCRPSPPSLRSSFSRQSRSDSMSRSISKNLNTPSTSHPTGLSLSLSHTLSISSSLTPSCNYSTTITSRSSSPASSLYLPLRIPIVRAPAPFFGPTAERVARVRERRQVAQRDAERAEGGWKAWWNNWYHQSDKFATRKGKTKQDPAAATHEHQPFNSNLAEESDSDDGSCYHDVILEHERKKLERKLKKLQKVPVNINPESQSCKHHHKKAKPNNEKTTPKNSQSWLSWISNWTIGLPPPSAHPLKLPTPGAGILCPHTSTENPILPARPVSPLVSNHSCTFSSRPTSQSLPCFQEVNSRTPLLTQSKFTPEYGNDPPIAILSQQTCLPSPDLTTSTDNLGFKSHTETRFGSAPRRWFTLVWWRWKITLIRNPLWVKICNKINDIFHID